MKKQRARTKKKNNLKPTVNKIQEELVKLQKRFNDDPDRFLQVIIRNQVHEIDFSSRWTIVQRRLKEADYSPEDIEKLKKRSDYFIDLFLQIERLKVTLEKEDTMQIYRRQPVLQKKGSWILQQSGEFRSIKSIHTELTERMGLNISIMSVRSFIAENKSIIDKLRDDFKTELFNSGVSVESGRLRFWEESFEYYYVRWSTDRKMSDFNACVKIINEVRHEVKGDVVVRINGTIDINHSIEVNKSLNQRLGEFHICMHEIGLSAQKVGINPLLLYSQLANSYYRDWNGITGDYLKLSDKDKLIPVSTFIKSYNWDEIKEKNKEKIDMGTIEDAYIISSEEEQAIIEQRKNDLLALLRKK